MINIFLDKDFNYNKKLTKNEMLDYLNSDKFDTFSPWIDWPNYHSLWLKHR